MVILVSASHQAMKRGMNPVRALRRCLRLSQTRRHSILPFPMVRPVVVAVRILPYPPPQDEQRRERTKCTHVKHAGKSSLAQVVWPPTKIPIQETNVSYALPIFVHLPVLALICIFLLAFPCDFPGCGKMFTVLSNAKRHLKTHGGRSETNMDPDVPQPQRFVLEFEPHLEASTYRRPQAPLKLEVIQPDLSRLTGTNLDAGSAASPSGSEIDGGPVPHSPTSAAYSSSQFESGDEDEVPQQFYNTQVRPYLFISGFMLNVQCSSGADIDTSNCYSAWVLFFFLWIFMWSISYVGYLFAFSVLFVIVT